MIEQKTIKEVAELAEQCVIFELGFDVYCKIIDNYGLKSYAYFSDFIEDIEGENMSIEEAIKQFIDETDNYGHFYYIFQSTWGEEVRGIIMEEQP
ncbi:MAG: hypothetical protein RML94_02640 [Bacteroidia bacterium]|nr:hypothetical protein [Bacteroidia bacterium]